MFFLIFHERGQDPKTRCTCYLDQGLSTFLALENAFSTNLGGVKPKIFLFSLAMVGFQETLYQVQVF